MKLKNIVQGAKNMLVFNPADKRGNQQALTFALLFGVFTLAVMPEIAMAAPWDSAAQKVLDILTGGLTRILAIIAVIACGIAAFFGKLSYEWAAKIVIGIVLVFGSASIVDAIIGASK